MGIVDRGVAVGRRRSVCGLGMEPRISIITLGVSDLQRSIDFYTKLGLPKRPSPEGIAFFKMQGTQLALFPRDSLTKEAGFDSAEASSGGFTLAHNVPSRGDVDRILAQAEAAGARITAPAQDRMWGGYSGYFADPDGFAWEVAWDPHPFED